MSKHPFRGAGIAVCVLACPLCLMAASGAVSQWAKAYGGNDFDRVHAVQQTQDGGYVMAGDTSSFGMGGPDIWVVKVNSLGKVEWQKTYGGSLDDYAHSVQATKDGGYIVAGWTGSSGLRGGDIWILKLGRYGYLEWQKTYGGCNTDWANSIRQTRDGGYIVAGATFTFGTGSADAWILRLSASGSVVWQKAYGGEGREEAYQVALALDGGYIVAGYTESFGAGGRDIWVLKLDPVGTITWQKVLGGTGYEAANGVTTTMRGEYVVAGGTSSFGADRWCDPWVLKLSPGGKVMWQKLFGDTISDGFYSVQQAPDGNYVMLGRGPWLVKLRPSGSIVWQRTYEGYDYVDWRSADVLAQAADGGYLIAADRSWGESTDFGLIKLDKKGALSSGCSWNYTDTDAVPKATKAWIASTPGKVTVTKATIKSTAVGPVNTAATVTDTCAGTTVLLTRK